MQLRIRGRRVDLTPEVRRRIERRVRLVLGRHGSEIAAARITVEPAASRVDPASIRSRVRARMQRGEVLAVEADAADATAAVDAAVWRLEHLLGRLRLRRTGS